MEEVWRSSGSRWGGSRINIAEIDGIETNFSGDYPTPGGVRMVNEAFIHYMEEEYWGIEK